MDGCLRDDSSTWLVAFSESKSPLVPHLRVGIVPPDLDLDLLALAHGNRDFDWEIQREPGLHAWSVLACVDTVEDILVQLSSEVACESVDLALRLLDGEGEAAVHAHRLIHTLRKVFELFLVGVGQMAESEDVTGFGTARERGTVDLDDVGKLIRMILLLLANAARDALVGVHANLVPKYLTTEGHQVVGIGPWDVDAVGLEVLLGWHEALRG